VQLEMTLETWRPILQDAIAKRQKLEGFSVNEIGDLQEKERLFGAAEAAIERLRFVGDYFISRALAEAGKTADLTAEELMVVSDRIKKELERGESEEESLEIKALRSSTKRMMNLGNPTGSAPRKPFHWLLEFPEVFLEGEPGFSAIVGNPPFLGRSFISAGLGDDYLLYVLSVFVQSNGNADICSHFCNASRGLRLWKQGGHGLAKPCGPTGLSQKL
jgi:hypothetical protein